MHYHAEIWVPNLYELKTQLAAILEPHKEGYDEKTGECSGFWDWYQVGGRYTGSHDPAYDPEKDPENIEVCWICEGTGFRHDALGNTTRAKDPSYTCNGCGKHSDGKWVHGDYGPGRCLKWPTKWRDVQTDIAPVGAINEALTAHTLIVGGNVLHKEVWDGNDFKATDFDGKVKPALERLGIRDGYLVTVDYHS